MFHFFKAKLPRITIKYSKLLDPIFIFYCKNNQDLKARGWNDWIPPTREEIMKRISGYRQEWRK
ncbi:MAG: hypothetical protein Q8Q36_01605, partial [bacterium]|nr:hypothetical protein [bacterium]